MRKCSMFLMSMLVVPVMAQPTARQWNAEVTAGWNLGNQLECSAPGQDGESVSFSCPANHMQAEIAWGNPAITQQTLQAVKDAGFNAVRIPVRWQCHITDALAALLSGRCNFSGRLPYTYPRESAALATYDYKCSEQVATMEGAYDYSAAVSWQWPFGYGLSYTKYHYGNLRVDKEHFTDGDVLTVSVDVTNCGQRAGSESVLLYSSDVIASLTPDNRRLRQFEKITLKPGETRIVTFRIPARQLAFVGYDGRWTLEAGDFVLTVGNQKVTVTCDTTTSWQ